MNNYSELILKNPKKAFIKLAIPLTFFNIFDTFYALITIFLAAFLGYNELLAIGLATPLLTLIRKGGSTLGIGTNSYVSRNFGANNKEEANNSFMHGFLICFILSILIPLICIPFLNEIMFIFNIKSNLSNFVIYLTPIFIFSFVFLFSEFFSQTLQSEGDSKRPTIYAIIGNVLNLIISPILAFNLNYGILGLSLGVIISTSVTFILLVSRYLFKSTRLNISIKLFNFKFKTFIEILKVSLPNFVDRSLYSLLSIYINMFFTFFTMNYNIALYAIYEKLSDLIESPSRGLSSGLLSVSGQLYGGNRIDELKSLYFYGLKISMILAVISSICFLLFHNYIFSLLMLNPNEINSLLIISIATVIVALVNPISFASSKILDSMGKSIYGLIGSLIVIISIILLSFIFNLYDYMNYSIVIAIIISELVSAAFQCSIVLYFIKKSASKTTV